MANRFSIEETYMRGLDEFVSMSLQPTGDIRPHTLSENKEWRLEARLAIHFWANNAEVHDAKRIALRAMYTQIYSDLLKYLPQLRLAISDGSKARAFAICDKIESSAKDPKP